MKNAAEQIEYLTTGECESEVALADLTADIYDVTSPGQVERAQGTVAYYEGKIREVLMPAIRKLRGLPETSAQKNVLNDPDAKRSTDTAEAVQSGLNRPAAAGEGV